MDDDTRVVCFFQDTFDICDAVLIAKSGEGNHGFAAQEEVPRAQSLPKDTGSFADFFSPYDIRRQIGCRVGLILYFLDQRLFHCFYRLHVQ